MNLREIFVEALRLTAPDERAAYLDEACAGDAALRTRLEALLAEQADLGSFLESPAGGEAETLFTTGETPSAARIGDSIGPYRILEALGEGGMGAVFLAEQASPVQRRVALKVIKPGLDSRQIISRFEAERQALAIMDHPHIAKVLDAGTTKEGRPYFVMELVSGVPLTKFCDERRLTPRERLQLFLPICQAVQHAHQKGIIHRDLKPSNILVGEVDGRPIPKVIDFGVAKAVRQPLTAETMLTEQGQILGTLEYMSPEQARLDALDIDTRSDIYSLGVVLYELLAGVPPLDRQRLRSAAFDELLRLIREEEPLHPSTRLSTADTLPGIAASRSIEPHKLRDLLRGDLDWIVMKAIEKDRARRYSSANELAADLERYLHDQPVLACPPSVGYRFRKFARRHQLALGASGLVALALIGGSVVSAWQAIRAQRSERLAERRYALAREAVDTFLNQVTDDEQLRSAPFHSLRRELLTSATAYYEQLLSASDSNGADQQMRADAWLRLGRLHSELGDEQAALDNFSRSAVAFEELVMRDPRAIELWRGLAGSHENRAWVLRRLGQNSAARTALQTARNTWERLPADLRSTRSIVVDEARTLNSLGNLHRDLDDQDSAYEAYEQARAIADRLLAENSADATVLRLRGQARHNLGLVQGRRGQRLEARRLLDAALEDFEILARSEPRALEDRRALAQVLQNRGKTLAQLGEHAAAESDYNAALAKNEELAREFPAIPEYRLALADALNDLGYYLQGRDNLPGAVEQLQKSVREAESLGDDWRARVALARAVHNLAWTQRRQGNYSAAVANFRRAIELRVRLVEESENLPARRHELATSWNDLGVALSDQGDREAALRAYREALQIRRSLVESSADPSYRVSLAGTLCNLGNLEANRLPPAEVLPLFDQAVELLVQVLAQVDSDPDASRYLRNASWSRAEIREKLGQFSAAVADWRRAGELSPEGQRQQFRRSLALALGRAGQQAEAVAIAEQLANAPQARPLDTMTAALVYSQASADRDADAGERERRVQRALELLELSRTRGLFRSAADVDLLKSHPGLAPVRDRPAFSQWLERVIEEVQTPSP